MLEGRTVEDATPTVEAPVILSAAAARRLFPNGSPIGSRIRRTAGPVPWWAVAAVTLLLVLTAFVATWLPARRAARIDPTEALRGR